MCHAHSCVQRSRISAFHAQPPEWAFSVCQALSGSVVWSRGAAMTDRIQSNRQERPDGMILYRPARNGPTYVLTKEHDAKIRKLLLWQVALGFVAGIPTLATLLSWLSGDLGLPAVVASMGAILAVATPMGLHLERRRKDIVRQAPVSET